MSINYVYKIEGEDGKSWTKGETRFIIRQMGIDYLYSLRRGVCGRYLISRWRSWIVLTRLSNRVDVSQHRFDNFAGIFQAFKYFSFFFLVILKNLTIKKQILWKNLQIEILHFSRDKKPKNIPNQCTLPSNIQLITIIENNQTIFQQNAQLIWKNKREFNWIYLIFLKKAKVIYDFNTFQLKKIIKLGFQSHTMRDIIMICLNTNYESI